MQSELLNAISEVKTAWTMAAFAIAAVVALAAHYGPKPGTPARRALYVALIVIVLLALFPTVASLYSESASRSEGAIYRVRVITVDVRNIPVSDVIVRSTALEERKSTVDGIVELAIPFASLPADKRITIFAAKPAAFLHAKKDIVLGSDHYPTITVTLQSDSTAKVHGAVQDNNGQLLAGAKVTVPGFDAVATTGSSGAFELESHAAPGQNVRLHVEKPGYQPIDQDQIVSSEPIIVQLVKNDRKSR
ncbi:MAG: carboxypeptidase-like regulatory domain-containing protein [Bryobacteraceae bacterium]